MKPILNVQQKKKNEARKRKKEGGEKAKRKSQDCCVTFKPKHYLKILLFAYTLGGTLGISGWGCATGTLEPWNP